MQLMWIFHSPCSRILGIDIPIEVEPRLIRPILVIQFLPSRFHEPLTIGLTKLLVSKQHLLGGIDFIGVHFHVPAQHHVGTADGESVLTKTALNRLPGVHSILSSQVDQLFLS